VGHPISVAGTESRHLIFQLATRVACGCWTEVVFDDNSVVAVIGATKSMVFRSILAHPVRTSWACSNLGSRQAVQNKMEQQIPHNSTLGPPSAASSGTTRAKTKAR
jgi:hypothetical protein